LGLAVVSLIILVVLGVVAGLVLARALGTAAARNEKWPGGEQDGEKREQMDPGAEYGGKARGVGRQAGLIFGGATALDTARNGFRALSRNLYNWLQMHPTVRPVAAVSTALGLLSTLRRRP
jgi:hypothetical protein